MSSTILQPGRNVWRIDHAPRAAVLVDGAAFFAALRQAFLNARRSIFIVGWDIDSRTHLVGAQPPDDGLPLGLSDFLSELVRRRPQLNVYILLWDFSIIYAGERELFPRLSLQWQTPDRVMLCMDDAVPFGSSQHQKLVVVDDALAFSGGLDLTQRRWDTNDHRPDDPLRVDTADDTYPPFHDVQMMVDGEAALALARLARRRWCRAENTEPPLAPTGDPWPQQVRPDFVDAHVGIARTEPAFNGQQPVKEVERLFYDSIARAQDSIYVENQYLSSLDVARRLAERLRERPRLELVTVSPRHYSSWLISETLGNRRGDFDKIVKEAGADRVRLTYPCVEGRDGRVDTMVHSKVMVIDDTFLRIGSANLNNRSMAVDTECDLVIEAGNSAERAAIAGIRNRLLSDHCGVAEDKVASLVRQHGSILPVVDSLADNGHRLCVLDDADAGSHDEVSALLETVVDPKRPLSASRLWQRLRSRAPMLTGAAFIIMAVLLLMLAMTVVWRFTPLSDWMSLDRVKSLLASVEDSGLAPLVVLVAYLLAGVIAFPVTVLILATVATFGPWLGFAYAAMGVLASAALMYGAGLWLGGDAMRAMLGRRWTRMRHEIDDRGVFAVAAIRLFPVAPFTLINLMAGACSVRFFDYLAGTAIGMLPGLIAMAIMGREITMVLSDMSLANVGKLLLIALGWIVMAWMAQKLVGRCRKRPS